MQDEVINGSCLCGTVRFVLSAPPTEILHCHCSMCRKAHGAVFATFARVAHADFSIVQGNDALVSYRSSPEARRTFCTICGSTLQFIRDGHDTFGLSISAIDTTLEPREVREYHTESMIEWLARTG